MLLENDVESQLRGGPNSRFQIPSDRLAINFNLTNIVSADNVLEQMRHFRKRAPLDLL